uniref:Uncharacterized protein n=1 Tax=Magallana gigas TaxID=29159 RepID=A0A8W8LCX6_MAGGI
MGFMRPDTCSFTHCSDRLSTDPTVQHTCNGEGSDDANTVVKQKLQSLQKMTVMATDMRKLKWRWHSKRYWDVFATKERISKEMGVLDLS